MERPQLKPVHLVSENAQLDQAVIASRAFVLTCLTGSGPLTAVIELPPRCEVLSVTPSGKSLWVGTFKIVVRLEDGMIVAYFKKVEESTSSKIPSPTLTAA